MSSSTSTELEVAGFHLEGELGRGSRAVVYEAIQVNLGRRVALKLRYDFLPLRAGFSGGSPSGLGSG